MNAILNEKNEKTEKIIHLLVTSLCDRNCKYCCNKQYSLDDIPYVTDDELKNAHTLCITGGEPFLYAQPSKIAEHYKRKYPNIKKIYVYTNAYELGYYLKNNGSLLYIDGVNVSIKTPIDKITFNEIIKDNPKIQSLNSNILYVFDNLYDDIAPNFIIKQRKWQKQFKAANDSIFRKV